MKQLLGQTIILVLISLNLSGQTVESLENSIILGIQNYRTNLSLDTFKLDPIVSDIARYSLENKFYKKRKKKEKEKVRTNLSNHHIYDNDFEVFNFSFKSEDKITLENILKESKSLRKVFKDSNYNNIGIKLTDSGKKYYLQLIVSKHFIEFNQVFSIEPMYFGGPPTKKSLSINIKCTSNLSNIYFEKTKNLKEEIKYLKEGFKSSKKINLENDPFEMIVCDSLGNEIKRTSNSSNIYVKTRNQLKEERKNLKEEIKNLKEESKGKKKINLNTNQSFELEIEYDENDEIIFYDSQGNVIAKMSNLI